MWTINATITKTVQRYGTIGMSTITKQIPTFYLNEDVQGIVSAEHAANIAKTIIDPFNEFETHIHAMRIRG